MSRHWLSRSNRHLRASADWPRDQGTDSSKAIERRAEGRRSENHDHHAPGRLAEGRRRDLCSSAEDVPAATLPATETRRSAVHYGKRIKRKEITAFTREMAALLGAAIPIPQALDG